VQEHADEVAGLRPDLLADDDGHAGGLVGRAVTRLDGAVDPVVVRDRQVGQATGRGRAEDGGGRDQRVEARRGVAVQVENGALGVRRRDSLGRGPRRSFTSALGGL
jgi:hypothetical protein